jgi:transposase-like protein
VKAQARDNAIKMREGGGSIREISSKLGVAKSSVSLWVRDVELDQKQFKNLSDKPKSRVVVERRRLSRLRNEEAKRQIILDEASSSIRTITQDNLRLIGAMLYWAEGGKTRRGMVRFSNSDPEMIKLMMKFFRITCCVLDNKFHGHIHIHGPERVKVAEKYWSGISGIPTQQFFKSYTKLSVAGTGERHTLPYGTFDIYVCDTKLFLTIMGWIKGIARKVV